MGDRVVLGLAGTVDYEIVWNSATVERLVQAYAICAAEISTAVAIATERDLICSLLGFVRDGSGGERFVASSEIVSTFASRFVYAATLGGTPVRAALAMDKLGVGATLHLVSIDDQVRRMLPSRCDYVCSAVADTTDPHLIVQFSAGTRVQAGDIDLTAPHPNRIIFANDPPSRELVLSDQLGSVLADAKVFLVSGFNVMQSPTLLTQRVDELKQHLHRLPPEALVIYEDSGFHRPALAGVVWQRLGDCVDVHSLNEDEMQAYLGRSLDLLDPVDTAAALRELGALLSAPTVVVHSKYWALAFGQDASHYAGALHGGITTASARYAHGDHFTQTDYDELAALPPSETSAAFATALQARLESLVCCVPANVLAVRNATTIGLGDSFVGGFIAALPPHRAPVSAGTSESA
jgi:ADP-dependent phosphofructokinase/glucokinase